MLIFFVLSFVSVICLIDALNVISPAFVWRCMVSLAGFPVIPLCILIVDHDIRMNNRKRNAYFTQTIPVLFLLVINVIQCMLRSKSDFAFAWLMSLMIFCLLLVSLAQDKIVVNASVIRHEHKIFWCVWTVLALLFGLFWEMGNAIVIF